MVGRAGPMAVVCWPLFFISLWKPQAPSRRPLLPCDMSGGGGGHIPHQDAVSESEASAELWAQECPVNVRPHSRLPFLQLWLGFCWILALQQIEWVLTRAKELPCPSRGYGFSSSHVWMWELDYKKKLSAQELMFLNCGVGEDSWESLDLQGDPTSPS